MSDPSDEELAERVAALEETLEELRDELEPPRGPFGLPRPPSPREVIRFTDEYAIPAAIAILEANVRTLQLLRAVLRGARGAPMEPEVRDRASSLGRTTVERVDGALADLQTAIEDADLPQNDEARSLLEEAQALNREIRDRLADANEGPLPRGGTADGDGTETYEPIEEDVERVDDDDTTEVEIDVDAELASIKDELDEDRQDENGGESETDDHGNDEDRDGDEDGDDQ